MRRIPYRGSGLVLCSPHSQPSNFKVSPKTDSKLSPGWDEARLLPEEGRACREAKDVGSLFDGGLGSALWRSGPGSRHHGEFRWNAQLARAPVAHFAQHGDEVLACLGKEISYLKPSHKFLRRITKQPSWTIARKLASRYSQRVTRRRKLCSQAKRRSIFQRRQ